MFTHLHLICLMNAYLLETSLQIQKLKAFSFLVSFHFKVMWNSPCSIKTFPPQLKDPLGLDHVFQLSMLNIYHPYQCHFERSSHHATRCLLKYFTCLISIPKFGFQIMSKLEKKILEFKLCTNFKLRF